MKCVSCGAEYRKEKSFETKDTVRTVCGCEVRAGACARKKRGSGCGTIVQAVLTEQGGVDFYLCDVHVVADAIRGVEDSPAEALKKRAVAVKKAETAAARAVEPKKALPPYDHTERWVRNGAKGDKAPQVCKGCGHQYPFDESKVLMGAKPNDLFEMACPKCSATHVHFLSLDNSFCRTCNPSKYEVKPHGKTRPQVGAASLRR